MPDCGIDREIAGWSSLWMAREKRPGNGRSLRCRIDRLRSDGYAPGVRLAPRDANAGRWCGAGQRSCRCLPISGSPALATLGTGSIARSCAGRRRPSRRRARPTTFPPSERWCVWMVKMALGQSFPM
jgi:hypothetical protein